MTESRKCNMNRWNQARKRQRWIKDINESYKWTFFTLRVLLFIYLFLLCGILCSTSSSSLSITSLAYIHAEVSLSGLYKKAYRCGAARWLVALLKVSNPSIYFLKVVIWKAYEASVTLTRIRILMNCNSDVVLLVKEYPNFKTKWHDDGGSVESSSSTQI